MENKTIFGVIFTFIVMLSGLSVGNALAQNTSLMYPNDTETIEEFEQIEGNTTAIFDNDTNISNPANNLEDSLAINENESN